uniref:Uncharacterized protein n=1 Tax=Zea mays TaxID=4577 RepID=A0A804NMZ2_MAIZE
MHPPSSGGVRQRAYRGYLLLVVVVNIHLHHLLLPAAADGTGVVVRGGSRLLAVGLLVAPGGVGAAVGEAPDVGHLVVLRRVHPDGRADQEGEQTAEQAAHGGLRLCQQ